MSININFFKISHKQITAFSFPLFHHTAHSCSWQITVACLSNWQHKQLLHSSLLPLPPPPRMRLARQIPQLSIEKSVLILELWAAGNQLGTTWFQEPFKSIPTTINHFNFPNDLATQILGTKQFASVKGEGGRKEKLLSSAAWARSGSWPRTQLQCQQLPCPFRR